jgi:hypothetical protein
MECVAIAGTFGSAMEHASDQSYLYYLVDTGTNQLSGHYGSFWFGWTDDTILVWGTLLFLKISSKGLSFLRPSSWLYLKNRCLQLDVDPQLFYSLA